jgi:hypothetical protein
LSKENFMVTKLRSRSRTQKRSSARPQKRSTGVQRKGISSQRRSTRAKSRSVSPQRRKAVVKSRSISSQRRKTAVKSRSISSQKRKIAVKSRSVSSQRRGRSVLRRGATTQKRKSASRSAASRQTVKRTSISARKTPSKRGIRKVNSRSTGRQELRPNQRGSWRDFGEEMTSIYNPPKNDSRQRGRGDTEEQWAVGYGSQMAGNRPGDRNGIERGNRNVENEFEEASLTKRDYLGYGDGKARQDLHFRGNGRNEQGEQSRTKKLY